MSWFHGRHSVKAGLIVSPHFHADKSADAEPVWQTSPSPTASPDIPTPTSCSEFHHDEPGLSPDRLQAPLDGRTTFFVTDDFKITPKLTLSAGRALSNTRRISQEANGREAMFDVGTGKIVVPNGSSRKVSPLLPRDMLDVVEAKDVGLPGDTLYEDAARIWRRASAWPIRPWGNNTVFRAGYGMFFDMVPRGASPGANSVPDQ